MPTGIPKNGINKGWVKKGDIGLTKGKHWKLSDKSKKNISDGNKRHGVGKWNKGIKRSEKTKELISKNSAKFWLGKKLSEETKKKIRISTSGENNWNWQNGKSFEKYGI